MRVNGLIVNEEPVGDVYSEGIWDGANSRVRMEGKLEYLIWPSPDGQPGVQPAAYVALEHVAAAQWQALDAEGRWVNAWPAGPAANALPRAISLRLTLAGGEEVTRVLALR